jgi:acyl transferase domain-containing protein
MNRDGDRTEALLKRAILQIQQLKAKLEALEGERKEPIAIVGMGCRLPGGIDGPDAYWDRLARGVDAIREVPKDRWDISLVYDPEPGTPGKMCTQSGGFLDEVDQFDPGFFGISRGEAASMDPQQRLLLEVAWEALENAGIAPDGLAGSRTGVFIGKCFNDHARMLARPPSRGGSGMLDSILANRISYFLDLRGPSLVLDTACSSSLVAVDLSCRSLRSGGCRLALAGGVNIILSPEMHIAFSHARMMAPDGRCKTFDARADGYSRGEGCALVVLKRLSDALSSGDRVLSLIRGSAVNQDGATNGISAPSGVAQEAVIREALAEAGVEAQAITLLEAHGTGTPLGDPIEVEALRAVYGAPRPEGDTCVLGSVKTNLGHLEAVAGIAGLMKVVLCMMHEALPPHLHFQSINPHIPLAGSPFFITTTRRPWPQGPKRRFAAVSSFGVGGTNAHAVLEEAPEGERGGGSPLETPGHVLVLSAQSEKALFELSERYARHLAAFSEGALADVCSTAFGGRTHFAFRLAIPARTLGELREKLSRVAGGGEGIYRGRAPRDVSTRVGFVFTKGGAESLSAGGLLHRTQPAFREALERCGAVLAAHVERPLGPILSPGDSGPGPTATAIAAARFAFSYALAEMWRAFGAEPAVVTGQGLGEIVAACVTRATSLEQGALQVLHRSRAAKAEPRGAVGAAGADILLVFGSDEPLGGASEADAPGGAAAWPASPRGGDEAWWSLLQTIAALYTRGVRFSSAALDPHPRRRVALPTYPFQRKRCWLEPHELRTWRET